MFSVRFYRTAKGNEVVLDFIKSFDKAGRQTIGEDLKTVQLGFPIGLPVCGSLGSGLYEVRSTLAGNCEVRLIFFQHEKTLVVVHGFVKKKKKTPKQDLDLALKRKKEFSP
jgi:phage-related protein